jgi:hypothetical protein
MENNENFAVNTAENVEQTTEETPKVYTEAEFNAKLDEVLGKKIARKEAKIRKEYDRKYGQLEEVLKAGTGNENIDDITDTFRQFYEKKGIQLPQKPAYDDADISVLAQHDAQNIISGGYEEVVEEVERLADIGIENMTAREKALFKTLAEHRQSTERGRELSKIGVTEDVYNSDDFKRFAQNFNPNVPISDVFDIYRKTQPQKEYKTTGSMKSNVSTDKGIKDFYTPEEAKKIKREELRKNPALMQKVEESMLRWHKK